MKEISLLRNRPMLFMATLAVSLMLFATVFATDARADLIGHWKFDGNADDSSGLGNQGFLEGDTLPTFSDDIPSQLGGGQSISFSGGNQHVLVPHSEDLDIFDEMTISAWVKPDNVGWDAILGKTPSDFSDANHAGNYELRIENGSRVLTFLHQRGGDNDTIGIASTGIVSQGTWQHVAVTIINGLSTEFYINGESAGSVPHDGSFGFANSNPLYIGSRADLFTTFDGLMDDVRIYDEALTPEAIADIAGPPPAPLLTHPDLDNVFARASSEFLGDGRLADDAVSGRGIVGMGHVVNPPAGNMWLTEAGDANPEFTIDLGSVHNVNDLRVWNYNEAANATCCLDRGIATADIFIAGADGVFGNTPVITGQAFAKAPGELIDFSEVVDLGGVEARFIKLAITSNHGDAQFTGISEINVTGTPTPGKAPIQGVVAIPSSNLVGFDRLADYLVDRSGLGFGDSHIRQPNDSVTPDGTMWLNQGTFGGDPFIHDIEPEITFDMGEVTKLDRMKVWNYYEFRPDLPGRIDELLGRGIESADIFVAGEDMQFELLIEEQIFDRAPDDPFAEDIGEVIDLLGTEARYVKFVILSNHLGRDFTDPFGDDGLFNFVGLSEVQFFSVVDATPGLTGDVNGDGAVNEADFRQLAGNFGTAAGATLAMGDISGDGAVGLADAIALQSNFGATAAAAAAVPEPSTIWLLVAALFSLCVVRVTRRRSIT